MTINGEDREGGSSRGKQSVQPKYFYIYNAVNKGFILTRVGDCWKYYFNFFIYLFSVLIAR